MAAAGAAEPAVCQRTAGPPLGHAGQGMESLDHSHQGAASGFASACLSLCMLASHDRHCCSHMDEYYRQWSLMTDQLLKQWQKPAVVFASDLHFAYLSSSAYLALQERRSRAARAVTLARATGAKARRKLLVRVFGVMRAFTAVRTRARRLLEGKLLAALSDAFGAWRRHAGSRGAARRLLAARLLNLMATVFEQWRCACAAASMAVIRGAMCVQVTANCHVHSLSAGSK